MKWLLGCGTLFALALILFVVQQALRGRCLSRSARDTGCRWLMWWRWCPCWPGHGCCLAASGSVDSGWMWRSPGGPGRLGLAPSLQVSGLGLLVASVLTFFWWWAIGAALLTATLLAAALVAAGSEDARARSRHSD
jgi:hypothetical protein